MRRGRSGPWCCGVWTGYSSAESGRRCRGLWKGVRDERVGEAHDAGGRVRERRQRISGAAPARKGAAGWVLLAGLGIAYVISGDAAGWHFGLGVGGWGGLLIATLLMATMYTAMVFA